mgnify:CR=1 FL=1
MIAPPLVNTTNRDESHRFVLFYMRECFGVTLISQNLLSCIELFFYNMILD